MSDENSADQYRQLKGLIKRYTALEDPLTADDFLAEFKRIAGSSSEDRPPLPDRHFMELALHQARLQAEQYGAQDGGDRPNPLVGCVVVTQNQQIAMSYRGAKDRNDHAEFIALTKLGLSDDDLRGADVYTTLEPCGERGPGKKACADWLIEKRVRRVIVGLWDVDPRGQGLRKLAEAGIEIDHFDLDLRKEIKDLNANFLNSRSRAEELSALFKVEEFYTFNRPIVQDQLVAEYRSVNTKAGFPLVVERGYILDHPYCLTSANPKAFLSPLKDEVYENSIFATRRVAAALGGRYYSDVKAAYVREVLGKEPNLYDGYSYRLTEIDTSSGAPLLAFAKSKYLGFVDSCEVLGFEASQSIVARAHKRTIPPGETLRGEPARIFDLSWRNAIAGISALLVLVDRRTGHLTFVAHHRENVSEAPNTLHVVPAGNFQPLAGQRSGGWRDEAWELDYSILEGIVREFLEEVLGLEEQVRLAARLGNWRAFDEDVAAAYRMVMGALDSTSAGGARCKVWFFGLGFDCVNLKPELLACVVMDRELFHQLRPLWSKEGRGQKIELTQTELVQLTSRPNKSWLSAGTACLQLAWENFPLIAGSLA
jgi:pyrimidine deaminase RibD-like protein